MSKRSKQKRRTAKREQSPLAFDMKGGDKNWHTSCMICGQLPTVHPVGLCGPCCFGEADTIGGNW